MLRFKTIFQSDMQKGEEHIKKKALRSESLCNSIKQYTHVPVSIWQTLQGSKKKKKKREGETNYGQSEPQCFPLTFNFLDPKCQTPRGVSAIDPFVFSRHRTQQQPLFARYQNNLLTGNPPSFTKVKHDTFF